MKDICVNTGRPCSGCQLGACGFRQAHKFTIEQLLNHCSAVCEKEGLWGNVNESRYREHDSVRAYLKELQRYKDLEEHGRLIELPCKVGDTVYCITIDNEIHSMVVQDIYHALVVKDDKTGELKRGYYRTKEAAEAKPAELKGGKNEDI